jgi:hypothetical protein
VWLPESVGFDVRDCTDLQNRGFSDDPDLGQLSLLSLTQPLTRRGTPSFHSTMRKIDVR